MAVIVSSANPYMFRHQGAILREFNNNKESQVQHVLQLTNVPYKQTARFLLSTGHLSNSLISLVPPPSHRPLPDRPRHTGPFQTGPFYTGPFYTGPFYTGPFQTGPVTQAPSRQAPSTQAPSRQAPSHRPLPDRPRHTGPFQTGPFYTGPFLLSFPFQRLSHLLQRMYSTCMSQ